MNSLPTGARSHRLAGTPRRYHRHAGGDTLAGMPTSVASSPAPSHQGRWARFALGTFVLLSAGAASARMYQHHTRSQRFEHAARRIADRAALLTLPVEDSPPVPSSPGETWLPPPRPVTRVMVSPTGISLDHAALVNVWPEAPRARFLATLDPARSEAMPLEYPNLVPLRDRRVLPEHKRGGAYGFVILPLQQRAHDLTEMAQNYARMTASPVGRTVNLYVDVTTPSRTLLEVLYTLGMEGYTALNLVVRRGGREGVVPLDLPTWRGRDDEAPSVALKILPGGYLLRMPDRYVAPGCTTVASPGITVANLPAPQPPGGAYDYAGLTRCIETLRRTWPALQAHHGLIVAPNADVPYGVIMATLAAVRGRRPGACTLAQEARARRYDGEGCFYPDVVLAVSQ